MKSLALLAFALAASLPAQDKNTRGKWEEWDEGITAQAPVGATELRLRSVLLRRDAAAPSSTAFRFSIPDLAAVSSKTATVQVRDTRDRGYFLNLRSAQCGPDPVCAIDWPAAPARSAGIRPDELWVLAKGQAADSGKPLLLPACLCLPAEIGAQQFVQFTFIPLRPINYLAEIFAPDGRQILKLSKSNAPADSPITLNFPLKAAHGRYKLVVRHVAASGSTVENTDDTFNFVVP